MLKTAWENSFDLNRWASNDLGRNRHLRGEHIMKNHLSSVMSAALLTLGLGACPVIATPLPLQDLGDATYDPNSGLEWLDLNLTAAQSYNSVLNGWNGYTTTVSICTKVWRRARACRRDIHPPLRVDLLGD
jgi:hypothetical protein